MRSPFPGMDPYLEDQGRWPDFHSRVITYGCDVVSQALPDDYVAQMGEEVRVVSWQEGHDRSMRPDVAIVRHVRSSGPEPAGGGMVATLEPIAIPFAAAIDEVRDTWIEIRRLPDERLVTAIEVLSPTNKGSSGLTEYLDKRHRLRTQGVNLVEIDLLIAGRRLPMAKPLPPGDFFTIISRASKSELGDVYAWSIQRPLPKIPIPLEDPDPDVFLDLAEVFALAYQRGRYARLINYNRPLDLPLHPQDKEWAEKVARERPELIKELPDPLRGGSPWWTKGERAVVDMCTFITTGLNRRSDPASGVPPAPNHGLSVAAVQENNLDKAFFLELFLERVVILTASCCSRLAINCKLRGLKSRLPEDIRSTRRPARKNIP